MQEERKFNLFRSAEQNQIPGWCLRIKVLQIPIILKPEPAKHLNDDRRYEHKSHQHSEPHEISVRVKLLRDPQIRAHVKQKCAHADDGENKIQPRIFRRGWTLHVGISPHSTKQLVEI